MQSKPFIPITHTWGFTIKFLLAASLNHIKKYLECQTTIIPISRVFSSQIESTVIRKPKSTSHFFWRSAPRSFFRNSNAQPFSKGKQTLIWREKRSTLWPKNKFFQSKMDALTLDSTLYLGIIASSNRRHSP